MPESINNESCRIFIKDNAGTAWQLFGLKQNKNDGSIYLVSPEFGDYEWLTIIINDGKPAPLKVKQGSDGHLSFHGTGKTHVRSADESKQLLVSGHFLLKPESKEISLKHLFTVMPKRPQFIPMSPALARKSDQLVQSSNPLRPFVVMAFAIPRQDFNITFQPSMHVDDMEEIPGAFLGFHIFPLIHHDILLCFYYTRHMEKWPKRNMLQFLDGIIVPVFKGRPNGMVQVDFVMPAYRLDKKNLTIIINMSGLPDLLPESQASKS